MNIDFSNLSFTEKVFSLWRIHGVKLSIIQKFRYARLFMGGACYGNGFMSVKPTMTFKTKNGKLLIIQQRHRSSPSYLVVGKESLHKIGDFVRVRNDLKCETRYFMHDKVDVYSSNFVVDDMLVFGGRCVKITGYHIVGGQIDNFGYLIEGSDRKWVDEMFEGSLNND